MHAGKRVIIWLDVTNFSLKCAMAWKLSLKHIPACAKLHEPNLNFMVSSKISNYCLSYTEMIDIKWDGTSL